MAAYVRRVVTTVLGRDAVGAKFRVSDNDNTDAAAFHRDAIRAPGATPFELLTCIVYLDDAAMQVVPGSHVRTYGAIEALAIAPQTLEFRAGDVMLFHAELVHRAKLTSAPRRRVIQIFDIAFCAAHARPTRGVSRTSCPPAPARAGGSRARR
jgi:ectoine hydroxylase-related dioxygenase (phytanoyl-CoA dioxygenase family)